MMMWNMKELRDLQVMGSDLQISEGAILPNFLTLPRISTWNLTKEVRRTMPIQKELGIQIKSALDAAEPLCLL